MSRNFASASNHLVSLGDVVNARFPRASAWSLLGFFFCTDIGLDERTVIVKGTGGAGTREITVRINNGPAGGPERVEIYHGGGGNISPTGEVFDQDKWYIFAVTCDGDEAASDINMYGYEVLTGTAPSGWPAVGTGSAGGTGTTDDIQIGLRGAATEGFDGDIAHVGYFDFVASVEDIHAYRADPYHTAIHWVAKHGCQFYLPLGFNSPEPDLSQNGNTGTVTGAIVGRMPPTAPMTTWPWFGTFTETAAPPAGRTTKNTDSHPLGIHTGMAWRINQP